MIDINIADNFELYSDYKKALAFLKEINNVSTETPESIFHIYSDIKNEKELLSVESFLATQDTRKCKLILWSDFDISSNELIKPYKDLINLRIYNPKEEFIGTPLENSQNWIDAQDTKHYMKSGILRFLAGYKYGGVWVDMDMVLLNSFAPILDQEWAYIWGQEYDLENFGPCAAAMNIFKNSEHAKLCLEEILKTPVQADSTCLDHQLLAKVYKKRQFSVFPSAFFNTEWQMNASFETGKRVYNPKGPGTLTESGWFKKNEYSANLFLDAFSWHWHNSSYKNHAIEDGSKFSLLQEYINEKLKARGFR